MDTFSRLHPFIILAYYAAALALVIWQGHPLLFLLMFVMMSGNSGLIYGAKKTIRSLFYSLGAVVLCVVINPLLNHRGVTTLLVMPGGLRITKEATLYGFYMALVLLGTLSLFSCFRHYMTSGKIMTLTGSRFPSFSLMFSMVLRIVPKVQKDYREITALYNSRPRVWSVLAGRWMEDSVERSMAMKQKHYGSGPRTSYYRKGFVWRDVWMLVVICGMTAYVAGMSCYSPVRVQFFPLIRMGMYDPLQWLVWGLYLGIPIWMRGKEECLWLLSRRRITGSTTRNSQHPQSR